MSYLLDRKNKNRRFIQIAIGIVVLLLILFFRSSIFLKLSSGINFIFRPFVVAGNNIGSKFDDINYLFFSKKNLLKENEEIKSRIDELTLSMANYNSILDENKKLKEILGRKNENSNFILAAVLAKPNRSLYDTLLIDIGSKDEIFIGDLVFALGNVPIGRVAEVFEKSSKVILFSTSKEKTEVVISGRDSFMEIIGRGGGNFEMILPRDFVLEEKTEVVLPGMKAQVVAISEGVISDPRDAFKKVLFKSPVNIQELKFVQIQK